MKKRRRRKKKVHRAGGVDKKNEGEWAEFESRSLEPRQQKSSRHYYTNCCCYHVLFIFLFFFEHLFSVMEWGVGGEEFSPHIHPRMNPEMNIKKKKKTETDFHLKSGGG